jgi:hypothetical protein
MTVSCRNQAITLIDPGSVGVIGIYRQLTVCPALCAITALTSAPFGRTVREPLPIYLPDGVVPPEVRLPDSEAKEPKYYKIVLMADGKATGDDI